MSAIASKNHYALLGNDPELDPDRATVQPPSIIPTKASARVGKRIEADNRRAAGSAAVTATARPQEDGLRSDRHANRTRGNEAGRGRGSGRGGRGGPRRDGRDDRANKTGIVEHAKPVDVAEQEFDAERDGLGDARKEENTEGIVANDTTPVDDAVAEEPEAPTKSYEEYLAEQAEKRQALLQDSKTNAPRAANEGSKTKFPEGKAISRSEEDEELVPASNLKNKAHRERKPKAVVDIGHAWVEQENSRESRGGDRPRGGAGRGGDRPRGEFRGGDRPARGGRGGRGGNEGGRGGRGGNEGGRGEYRGGSRGNRGAGGRPPNTTDNLAFPALGGSS